MMQFIMIPARAFGHCQDIASINYDWEKQINTLPEMAMDQYLYIPFLGDEHPFTSYFDVHQG